MNKRYSGIVKTLIVLVAFIFVFLFQDTFSLDAQAAETDIEVNEVNLPFNEISVDSESGFTNTTILDILPDYLALTYGSGNDFTTAEITNWTCVSYDDISSSYIPSTFSGSTIGEYFFKATYSIPTGYKDSIDTLPDIIVKVKVEQYYTVDFANGSTLAQGTVPGSIKVAAGNSIILPNNPFTNSSYSFTGWSDGSSPLLHSGDPYVVTKNTTLTAVWSGEEINGYVLPSDIKISAGTSANLETLIASGILPTTVNLNYGTGIVGAEIDISTIEGLYDGNTVGTYTITAKFIMPDGYIDADATIPDQHISFTIIVEAITIPEITGFTQPDSIYIKKDSFTSDTLMQSGLLPSSVILTYGTNGLIESPISSWTCDTFNGSATGIYTFIGSYAIPNGYTIGSSMGNVTMTISVYEDYIVQFTSGNSSAIGSVPMITLTPSDSKVISLPVNGFTLPGFAFSGWFDGINTYSAGDSYTVNSQTTFTAKWEKVITSYSALDTIYIGVGDYEDDQVNGLILDKLPNKIIIYGAGYSTSTAISWSLQTGQTLDGDAIGNYIFTGTYIVPEGYANPESGAIGVTINLSIVKNKIYIYNDAGNKIVVANDMSGTNATYYNTESIITINGTNADDFIYFNLTNTYSSLASIIIDGKAGKDTITTTLVSGNVIGSENVDITLNAEQIVFAVTGLTWNVKSLTINATPDSSYLEQLLNSYQSTMINVTFDGLSINATGAVIINADADLTSKLLDFADGAGTWVSDTIGTVTDWTENAIESGIDALSNNVPAKEDTDTVSSKGAGVNSTADTVDSTMNDLANASLCVDIKPVTTKVKVNNTNIIASSVSISATTEIAMFTLGVFIPIIINIATVENTIIISGSSTITSTLGNIYLNTNVNIDAKSKVLSFSSIIPINFSLGVTVIDSTSTITIKDNANLISAGSININSINTVIASTSATAKSSNASQSGVVVAVAVVNQNTGVSLEGSCSITAGADINIFSTETCITSTSAVAGKASTSENLELLNSDTYSVNNILNFLKGLKNTSGNSLLKENAILQIENSFNDASTSVGKTTINIKVYDTDETTLISGATLQLTDPEGNTQTAITDAKGVATFTIDSAVAGIYKYVITQLPTEYQGRTLPGSSDITIETDKNTYEVNLVLDKGTTFSSGSGSTGDSQKQMVGTFAVEVIDNNNVSQIITTGNINASGNVTVSSNAITNNTTLANSSTISGKSSSVAAIEYKVFDENGNALKGVEVSLIISLKDPNYVGSEVYMHESETSHTFKAITNAAGVASFVLETPSILERGIGYSGNKIGTIIDTTNYTYVLSVTGVPKGEENVYSIPSALQNINLIFNAISSTATSTTYNYSGSGVLAFKDKTVSGTTSKSFGGGVAIAINIVNYTNKSIIGDGVKITANGLAVIARSGDIIINSLKYDNLSSTKATAGFNVGNFGIGGAISINVYLQETSASIADSAIITLNGGNLSIQALDKSTIYTFASASQSGTITSTSSSGTVGTTSTGTTDSVGVGSGIAVSIYTNKVSAYVGGIINGLINNVVIIAYTDGTNTTYASAGSSGGKAIVPVVALDISYIDVKAILGINLVDLTANGSLTVSAFSARTKSVTANAKASGEDVAAGGAFTVSVDSYSTVAQVARDINVGGILQVKAFSDNSSTLIAYAGANGATPGNNAPTTTSNTSSTGKVDSITNNLMSSGQKMSKLNANNGVPGTTPQSASTTEGSVSVAGSVTVGIFTNFTVASILSNAKVKGALVVSSLSNSDVLTEADSSATNSEVGVGVAVVIQVDNIMTQAFIGSNTTIDAGSITVTASIAKVNDDEENKFQLKAISGAGASKVGVAGAVSIGIINIDTNAFIHSDSVIVTTGDISVTALQKNFISNQAGAAASIQKKTTSTNTAPTKSVGVGASFALTIASTNVLAYIGNADMLMIVAGDIIITTKLINSIVTTSEAGESAGYSDSTKITTSDALDVAVAVVIVTSDIKSAINEGVTLIAGGDLIINANTGNTTQTVSQGSATATSVAVGGSITLNIIYEDVMASMEGNVALGGNAYLTASASTVDISTAYATAAGLLIENYASKLNTTVDKILSGQYLIEKLTNTSGSPTATGNTATKSTEAVSTKPAANEVTSTQSNISTLFSGTNANAGDTVLSNLYPQGSTYTKDSSLSTSTLNALNVKTTDVNSDTSNIVDTNKTSNTDANGDTTSTVTTTNSNGSTTTTTTAGTTSTGKTIAVAAAIGINIISHDVQAIVTGNIIRTTGLIVSATNNNDFQTLGTGAAVTKNTAIAVGVAVMINNCTTKALLSGNVNIVDAIAVDSNDLVTGNLVVTASAVHNLGVNFTDQISAQAIAGAATGSSGIGVAGAAAILVSNSKVIAEIKAKDSMTPAPVIIVAAGDVKVTAYEKSKLAVRAWAASISSTLLNGSSATNSSTGALSGASGSSTSTAPSTTTNGVTSKSTGSGVGIGAAFAILISQDEIKAFIGDGVSIKADSVAVISTKAKVDASDYSATLTINGYMVLGNPSFAMSSSSSSSAYDLSKTVYINTTNNANNTSNKLDVDKVVDSLLGEGLDLINILATNNYYVEAAGGAVSTNSSASTTAAGSFAIIYYSNNIIAAIGNSVNIELNENSSGIVTVTASSDITTKAIAGALAYGGSTSVGLTAVAVCNQDKVSAFIGTTDSTTTTMIIGQKAIVVEADQNLDLMFITVAAATSGTATAGKAVNGVIGAIISENDVTSAIYNTEIYGSGNISITADNHLKVIAVLGGASYGSNLGVGASIGVNVIGNTTKAILGDGVILGNAGSYVGSVLIQANASEWILDIVINGAASSTGIAVAASPAVNILKSNTYAIVGDSTIYSANLSVLADADTWLLTIAGAVSVSKGSASVGGSVDVIVLSKDVIATVSNTTANIYTTSSVNVKATSSEEIYAIVIGCSVGNSVAVAGSIAVIVMENDVVASLTGTGIIGGDINVWSIEDVFILVAAGGVGVSTSGAGVGIASSTIVFSGNTKAILLGTGLTGLEATGNVLLKADTDQAIYTFVIPVAVANSAAVAVGINVIVMNENTWSVIEGKLKASYISLDTDDDTDIIGFIIGVAASSSVSVGGSIETITFEKNVKAYVVGQSQLITTVGSIAITANSSNNLLFVVIGVSGSGTTAVNGSIAVVYVKDNVQAYIESGVLGTNTLINAEGDFILTTANNIKLRNIVGSVSVSGTVAVGGAIHTLIFSGSTQSYVGDYVTLTVIGTVTGYTFYNGVLTPVNGYNGGLDKNTTSYSGILISAINNQEIDVWVISGSGSGTAAVAGSINVIVFDESTYAGIGQYSTVTSGKGIAVIALDESQVTAQVGQAGVSGTASIGVGADTLYFQKEVTSSIGKGSTVKANGGNLIIIANSYDFLRSLSVGISISGVVSINGSASVVIIDNKVSAFAGTADTDTTSVLTTLESYGSLVISAEDYQELLVTSGAASFSGTAAVGAGVSVITGNQIIKAYLGTNTNCEVLGNLPVQFYTGNLDNNKKKTKGTYYGLLIGAFNTSDIHQIVFSGSASVYASVAIASATLINNAQTSAKINSYASVNQGNRAYHTQSVVRVVAVDTSDTEIEDAGAAGGLVGVSVAAVVVNHNKTTTAGIESSSSINAKAGVEVIAKNYNQVILVGASIGGGIVGVSGAATIYILTDITTAYISGIITSGGYIRVLSDSIQDINVASGAASVGGVAVGSSATIFTFNGITKAYVATNSSLSSTGSITIQASSVENVIVISAAGSVGLSTAVSGSLALSIINMIVQAYSEDNVIILASGDLLIKAIDDSNFTTTADNLSASQGVGVGGAADIFIYRNTVSAFIGNFNTVTAASIIIHAEANRQIDAYTVAAAAGTAGVSGSVVVLLVGSSATDTDTSISIGNTGNDSDANVNSAFNSSKLSFGEQYNNTGLSKSNADVLAAQNRFASISSYFTTASVLDKTMASIGDGGTVTTTVGNITVEAIEITDMTVVSGSLSGGFVGVGGAVAIAIFNGTTESRIGGTVTAVGTVNVTADSTVTADSFYTVTGSAGVVGIGASVSVLIISGTVKAYINSGTISANGNVNIKATLTMNANPYTSQASLGGIAAGASISTTKLIGTIAAYEVSGASIIKAGTVTIQAKGVVTTSAISTAVAGGIGLAANASVATLVITQTISAYAAGSISGNITDVTIYAILDLSAQAKANGYSIAGLIAAGASVTYVSISPTIKAYIASGASIDINGNLNVVAFYNVNEITGAVKANTVIANASATSAAYYAGASGAVVTVDLIGTVESYINGATIQVGETVSVAALGSFKVNASAGGLGGGLVGVGVIVVTVTNTAQVKAHIDNSILNVKNLVIISNLMDDVSVQAQGVSGGILAAGNAQVATLTDSSSSYAYITGSNSLITTSNDILIQAINDTRAYAKATGYAVAGFVSGGASVTTVTITKVTKAYVDNSVIVNASGNITIVSTSESDNDIYAQASAAAFGGGLASTSITFILTNATQTVIGQNASLSANGDITLKAISNKNDTYSFSTAKAGAVLAVGIATSKVTVTDTTQVIFGNSASVIAFGNVYIESNADNSSTSHAAGGAGGAFTGNAVEATINTTENAYVVTGTNTIIKSNSGNVEIYALTTVFSLIKSEIDFSVDITSFLKATSTGTTYVNAIITLGSGTNIIAGKEVTIWAEVEKIDIYAWSRMETTSVLYTKACPTSILSTTVHATVSADKVNISAGTILTIYALVDADISIKTYSYGFTAGTLGSIISTCTNNTYIYGTITITDSATILKGTNIDIKASSPTEFQVTYTKDASYKAYTVSEFVSQAITKTKTVIEYISVKVTKWLPWPINKVVKWVTKAITKVISWIEYILVEVILQSECTNYNNGSYNATNNITLFGNIYYGNSAPVNIVVNEDGTVTGADGISSNLSGNTVTLTNFNSLAAGSLNISSYIGNISGNVTVHNNTVIQALTIINNSIYNLVINDLSLMANDDADASNYNLNCSTNNLEMNDVTDATTAPIINIFDTQGKNITFNGVVSCYSAYMNIVFQGMAGNLYISTTAQLDVNKLTVTNVNHMGTSSLPFNVSMFISRNSLGIIQKPEIIVNSIGDAYLNITLKQFIDSNTAPVSSLDGFNEMKLTANGVLFVTLNGGMLLTASESTVSAGTISYDVSTYSYEYIEIKEPIAAFLELNITDGTYSTVYRYTQDYMDINGVTHLMGSIYTYDKESYQSVSHKVANQKYYLVNKSTNEQTLINDPIAVSIETSTTVYRYKSDYTDANDVVHLAGSEYLVDMDVYYITLGEVSYTYYLVKEIITIDTVNVELSDTVTGSTVSTSYIDTTSNITLASGNIVTIIATNTNSSKVHNVAITGQITGKDSVTITTMNGTNVIISGSITNSNSDNNSIIAMVNGRIEFTATGVMGNASALTYTDVSITATSIITAKTSAIDILGKSVTIIINGNMGSISNPIRIQTNNSGLMIDAIPFASTEKNNIYLSDNNMGTYLKSIETNGNVWMSTASVMNVESAGINNILASGLTLTSTGTVGTLSNSLVTNIGLAGINIWAINNVYINQLYRDAYLSNVQSVSGNVTIYSEENMVVTAVSAAGTVNLTTNTGSSLINSSTGNAVSATNIILSSGGSIGTGEKTFTIELGAGYLIGDAVNNIYITDTQGTVRINSLQSINGNIELKVVDVQVGTITTENGAVTIIVSNGNIKAQDTSGLVKAKDITLIALGTSGMIGTSLLHLNMEILNNGTILSIANGGIYLNNVGYIAAATITAGGDIIITSAGTIVIDSIIAGIDNSITLVTTIGDIVNKIGTVDTLIAKEIDLTSSGNIGTSTVMLRIALGLGSLTAKAINDIYIVDNADAVTVNSISSTSGNIELITNGNLIVGSLTSTKTVNLNVNGYVQGISSYTGTNITAKDIIIQADSIGTAMHKLITSVNVGSIWVITNGDIYLKDISGSALISYMKSTNGSIYFESSGNTAISSMEAYNIADILSAGDLTIGMLTAAEVNLNTTNNGSILAGTTLGAFIPNISTDILNLIAAGAIGSSTSPVTTNMTGNSCSIMGQAGGNIYLKDIYGEVTIKGLVSNTGGIILITNGTTRVESASAKEAITLTALTGALNIITMITETKASVTAAAGLIANVATESDNIIYNIKAEEIILSSFTTIGAIGSAILTDAGTISATALGTIVLTDIGAVTLVNITTTNNGDAYIITNQDTTIMSMNIDGNIELTIKNGNLRVNTISAKSALVMNVFGTVINNNSVESIANLFADSITITANQVGLLEAMTERYIVVTIGIGNLNLIAKNTSYVKAISSSLNLGSIIIGSVGTYKDLYLISEVDTFNGLPMTEDINTANVNITAANIIIKAFALDGTNTFNYNFGLSEKHIIINTDEISHGEVTILGGGNIYITEIDSLTIKVLEELTSLSITAVGDITYSQINGNANIGVLITEADVIITAHAGSILNVMTESQVNIKANDISLYSVTDTIGTALKNFVIELINEGKLNALTNNKGIYIYGFGNLVLETVNAVGTALTSDQAIIVLTAKMSILNSYVDDQVNIFANVLTLITESGTIGTSTAEIRINLIDNSSAINQLNIIAYDSVYLIETLGDLGLGVINVSGLQFILEVSGNIYTTLTQTDMLNGIANICAKNVIITSLIGQIGFDSNPSQSYIDEDYYGWITTNCNSSYEFSAKANGDIFIREIINSLVVGEINSLNGNISISAYNDVISYNKTGSDRINVSGKDIYVETTYGKISLIVVATGDIIFNSYGSITNLKGEGIDMILIVGNNITIISKAGGVGQEDSYIEIDSADGGVLNVDAYLSIYIREIKGNLTIGSLISRTGDVMLDIVEGDLISTSNGDEFDIQGKNIKLVSHFGNIGSLDKYFIIDSDGDAIMEAAKDIFLKELIGDLIIKGIIAGEEVFLVADQNIMMSDNVDAVAISALSLNMRAGNSIGTLHSPLTITLKKEGLLTALAKDSIYILSPTTDLTVNTIKASDIVILEIAGNLYNVNSASIVNLTANIVELTVDGQIGTRVNMFNILANELTADVNGDINITSPKNLVIHTLISANGDIYIKAKGSILVAKGSEYVTNIYGDNQVLISDTGHIGTEFVRVRIDIGDVGILTALAETNIYLLEVAGDVNIESVVAKDMVNIQSLGNILNGNIDSKINVSAHIIVLSVSGQVGNEIRALTIISEDSSIIAGKSIYLLSPSDINVNRIQSGGDVFITTNKSVFNVGLALTIETAKALIINVGENIGTVSKYINVSCNSLEAYAGKDIFISSLNAVVVKSIQANFVYLLAPYIMINNLLAEELVLDAQYIEVLNLTVNILNLKNAITAGTSQLPLKTSANIIRVTASSNVVINNSKSVIVEQMEVSNVILQVNGTLTIGLATVDQIEMRADSIISSPSGMLTANRVIFNVINGLGSGKTRPFMMNANYLTGKVENGSAYISNGKSLQIEELSASDAVYLFINGNLTGIGTAIRANRLIFETASFTADTIVSYLEGYGSGNITIINTGRTVLGNADNDYNGVSASGTISITAKSPIEVYERIQSGDSLTLNAGTSTTMEDSVTINKLANIISGNIITISAGDNITMEEGSTITGKTVLIIGAQSGESADTSIIIKGIISSSTDTTLMGTQLVDAVITSDMGNVFVSGGNVAATFKLLVYSINGNIIVTGTGMSDQFNLDMQKRETTGGTLIFNGGGGDDEINLMLDLGVNHNTYIVNNINRIIINTTIKDEIMNIYSNYIESATERINIYNASAIEINNPGGTNVFTFYDTPCKLTLNSGNGNDTYNIGKIVKSPKNAIKTTDGWLTNGISHKVNINDFGGKNKYIIYSIQAKLFIKGAGKDLLILKAFIEITEDGNLIIHKNNEVYIDGVANISLIKAGLLDKIAINDGTIDGSGFYVIYDGNPEITIEKYKSSNGATDNITLLQLINYTVKQLIEYGYIYYIAVLVIILSALGLAIRIKGKRKKALK